MGELGKMGLRKLGKLSQNVTYICPPPNSPILLSFSNFSYIFHDVLVSIPLFPPFCPPPPGPNFPRVLLLEKRTENKKAETQEACSDPSFTPIPQPSTVATHWDLIIVPHNRPML